MLLYMKHVYKFPCEYLKRNDSLFTDLQLYIFRYTNLILTNRYICRCITSVSDLHNIEKIPLRSGSSKSCIFTMNVRVVYM